MMLHAAEQVEQVVRTGRAPVPMPMIASDRSPEAAPSKDCHQGFAAWLYDVSEVRTLCSTVAERYTRAADGYQRAAGDASQLAEWERGWAAKRAELVQVCGKPRESGKLLEIDSWTCYAIQAKYGETLDSLHRLWQHWADRLANVLTRDPESIRRFYSEFEKAWHIAARRPRTACEWMVLHHYDFPLATAVRLLGPQDVGYHAPSSGHYSEATRARELHERGDLWNRILPRDGPRRKPKSSPSDAGQQTAFRGRRPPRRVVERVLLECDGFLIR